MDHDAKDTDYLKNLGPVLEECAQWFGQIATAIAYPEEEHGLIQAPSSYRSWQKQAEEADAVSTSALKNLTESYEHMVMEGRAINKILSEASKPDVKIFESFKKRYDVFFRQIRRLEHSSALEEGGMDEQTGLRSAKSIEADMKRELERLERQGTAFCQVMARIDQFGLLKDHDSALNVAVKTIENTIRPFDDAYYLGGGHFLISMKQADVIGAEAGVKRIRAELAQQNSPENITLSFCMLEPVVGDKTDKMLKNMRQDLDEHENAIDTTLKFKEISELERFISSTKS